MCNALPRVLAPQLPRPRTHARRRDLPPGLPHPVADDNELLTLEAIHQYVEVLDKYFGNVCELDLIFNFHKVRRKVLAAENAMPCRLAVHPSPGLCHAQGEACGALAKLLPCTRRRSLPVSTPRSQPAASARGTCRLAATPSP